MLETEYCNTWSLTRDKQLHSILNLLRKHANVLDNGLNWSPRHAQYTSPQIQNDLIRLIGQQIQRSILADVRGAKWFGFIPDETPDVSHIEQVRYFPMPIDQIEYDGK